jgi:hypothetical protein
MFIKGISIGAERRCGNGRDPSVEKPSAFPGITVNLPGSAGRTNA